ncbi:MAG: hypothetical protein JWP35_2579 [Caulobacter sp.]|nr:hypothetical protein [Caulobacter sp.]
MAKLVPESDTAAFETGKAISLPLGMASPLWFAFAGAAATGAAFWWMSRWANPTNLEALAGWTTKTADTAVEAAEVTAETVQEAVAEPALEAVMEFAPEPVAETLAALAPEPVAEPIAEATPELVVEAAPEPEPAPAPAPAILPDDLSRIVGIGPKLSIALAERSLTTFAQLAALTTDDLAQLDKALDLKGRAVRDAWVAQAARFAESV